MVEDGATSCGNGRVPRVAALEHVANRPIADHVLEELASAGVREVVVPCRHEHAREIREALRVYENPHGLSIQFVEHDARIDLSNALALAAPDIGRAPCIVHLASGLLGEPLSPLVGSLQDSPPDVVLVAHRQPAADEHLSPAAQDMLRMALHPERAALGIAGVWLFGPGALLRVGGASWRSVAEVDLTSVAERIATLGGSVQVRLADAWRNYRGDPLDLLELNQMALDRLEVGHRRTNGNGNGRTDGNRIEGRVRIHETAVVSASMIVGPTVIGPGARVADAYIGPYTSIGASARIEGAEIERSIIGTGTSIMHIGGRLVASVVGRDARIFRDFSLPRALRLRVGDGTEVALC